MDYTGPSYEALRFKLLKLENEGKVAQEEGPQVEAQAPEDERKIQVTLIGMGFLFLRR